MLLLVIQAAGITAEVILPLKMAGPIPKGPVIAIPVGVPITAIIQEIITAEVINLHPDQQGLTHPVPEEVLQE